MKTKLSNIQHNIKSLTVLKDVNKSITEHNFHEHTYILYDIRTLLGENEKTYLEIGSYIGSSASLILQHPFKTKLICIDPCRLNKSHYLGDLNQYSTLEKNLQNNNKNNYNFKIEKNFSTDVNLLTKFKDNKLEIDILFIDGGHRYNDVVQDWNNYKDFVNPGGFIVFDDYCDKTYSPEVKSAVDDIVKNLNTGVYEIIGTLDNIHKLDHDNITYKYPNIINEFIIYKKLIC